MPAEVVMPDGRVLVNVRAFVTTERFVVWRELKDKTLEKVIDVALSEPVDRSTDKLTGPLEIFTLTQGFLVNQGKGCGCRLTRLKALSPPAEWASATVAT